MHVLVVALEEKAVVARMARPLQSAVTVQDCVVVWGVDAKPPLCNWRGTVAVATFAVSAAGASGPEPAALAAGGVGCC